MVRALARRGLVEEGERSRDHVAAGGTRKPADGMEGGFALVRPRVARDQAPFVHSPLASRSIRRGHLALCLRRLHSVTRSALVKNQFANLYRFRPSYRDSLQVQGTAAPLRGSTLASERSPLHGCRPRDHLDTLVRPGLVGATTALR